MEALKAAVRAYARTHANADGLARTDIAGLRMMCVETPRGDLHSVYRPLICLVLQGEKQIIAGREQRLFSAGQSAIVSADMPVVGRIVRASPAEPYLAVAVELQPGLLREVTAQLYTAPAPSRARSGALFAEDTNGAILDCATRLVRLLDLPEATSILHDGIMRELHYWLLAGPHRQALLGVAAPTSHTGRLGRAIALLRADYRSRIGIADLAAAAGMGLTAFHRHFKQLTSLTPGRFQQRLRLVEARRLMLEDGLSASSAAFEVGYESVSQFTREYRRLFEAPPRRDVARVRHGPDVAAHAGGGSAREQSAAG